MAHKPAVAVGTPDASFGAMAPQSTEVPVNPTSNAANDNAPALAVPVNGGSKPAYHEKRSMSSLKRMVRGVGHAVAFVKRASRKVAPEGNEQQKANALAGVSQAFLEDFMLRVLPQFGIDRNALATPKTRKEWLVRLQPQEGAHVVNIAKQDVTIGEDEDGQKVELVNLGHGLQARKSDVEHVRSLLRLPRCRNKKWELVEAEVDLKELPANIDADTPLLVRIKGDPNAKWMNFLKARDVALIQTSDIVDFIVKSITQWKNGKQLKRKLEAKVIDGEEKVTKSERKTYAEHMMEVHPKGPEWVERNYFGDAPEDGGNIFVSHAWMDSYLDFSDALTEGVSKGDARYRVKVRREFELGLYGYLMQYTRFRFFAQPEHFFEYITPPEDPERLVPYSFAYRWTRLFGSWRLISDEDKQRMPAYKREYLVPISGDGGDGFALFEFYNICGGASRREDNEETALEFESRQDGVKDEERMQQELKILKEQLRLLYFMLFVQLPAIILFNVDLVWFIVGIFAGLGLMLGLYFGVFLPYSICFSTIYSIISALYIRFSTTEHLDNRVSEFRQLGLCDKNRHWIDIFCKNQWVVNSGDTQKELEDRVANVDCLYLICHCWNAPQTLKRVWCQFELRAARVYNITIVGMICDREIEKFRTHLARIYMKAWPYILFPFLLMTNQLSKTEEVTALETSIRNIDARTAEAQYPKDKETILALIRKGENTTAAVASDGETEEDRKDRAIDAHNQSLKECYMLLLETLLGIEGALQKGIGYHKTRRRLLDLVSRINARVGDLGSKFQTFILTSMGLSLVLICVFGIIVYCFDSRREFHLAFFVGIVGIVLGFTLLVLDKMKREFISAYFIDPHYSREARRRHLEATGTLALNVSDRRNGREDEDDRNIPRTHNLDPYLFFYGGIAATFCLIYHYVTHGNI